MLYLYGIIPTSQQIVFEFSGFPAVEAAETNFDKLTLRNGSYNEEADTPDEVYTLPCGELAAVVGPSPLPSFSQLPQETAVRYLLIHQQVTERVMASYQLLPVKFGTVLPSEAHVERLLQQNQTIFCQRLRELRGLIQMEVLVLWALPQLFEQIGQLPQIVELQQAAAQATSAEQLSAKVALGQAVKTALEERRATLQTTIKPVLQRLAVDVADNPLRDDSMVLNTGLLLDATGQAGLDDCLEQLDAQFDGQLTFRCVGPLPPHSFATVSVELPPVEAIESARQQLALPQQTTVAEIKQAYHRLASQHHPDHQPQADSSDLMSDLSAAYKLLTAYAATQPQTELNGHQPCDLRPEMVAESLLVRVGRQQG